MNASAAHRYDVRIEVRHWPKCYRCSLALKQNYPVEYFGIVGREPPKTLGGAYDLVIEVKCTHGEEERRRLFKIMSVKEVRATDALLQAEQIRSVAPVYGPMSELRIAVAIPTRWVGEQDASSVRGSATELAALGKIYAFAPTKEGHMGVVYMPGDISRRHGLETSVR